MSSSASWRCATTRISTARPPTTRAGPTPPAPRTALRQLDAAYGGWITGVRTLGADDLNRPCGPAEGPYADHPLGELILHINREVIHHGAEIACIRDLYAHTNKVEN